MSMIILVLITHRTFQLNSLKVIYMLQVFSMSIKYGGEIANNQVLNILSGVRKL